MMLSVEPEMFDGFGSLVLLMLKVFAALCCLAAAREPISSKLPSFMLSNGRNIWRAYSIVLIVLAIFGLLNIETLVSESIREDAKTSHWYEFRRYFQFVFLVMALIFARKTYSYLQKWLDKSNDQVNLTQALHGISLQLFVTLLQVVSWHYSDEILNLKLPGMSLASLLSLIAMLIVVRAALRASYRLRRV